MRARTLIRTMLFSATALLLLPAAAQARLSAQAERRQTRDLNLQQAQMAEQQNAPSQPKAAATDAAAHLADNAPPAAAPTAPIQVAAIQTAAGTASTVPLNSIANPPPVVATANVVDAKGSMVGAVQKVVMDASGKPSRVDVSLMGTDVIVAMDAAQFQYDPASNVLTALLDAQQITEQPRAPQG